MKPKCIILFCFALLNSFSSLTVSAQKSKYISILKKVTKNITNNYDSVICAYNDYLECAYVDSSKEIKSAVQMNTLQIQSVVISKTTKNTDMPYGHFLLSGSKFEKELNIGYSSFLELQFGGNAYSYPEMDRVQTLRFLERLKDKPKLNTPVSIHAKLKDKKSIYFVKDTIYNGENCFLLKSITKESFVLNKDEYLSRGEFQFYRIKEATGNWDTCYSVSTTIDVINKKDYAVLFCSGKSIYSNKKDETRKYFFTSKYKKIGNYYFQEYYEQNLPRLFRELKGGINDRDLYTLIYKASTNARIENLKEKTKELKKIDPKTNYNSFLEKKQVLSTDIQDKWEHFWKG